MFNHKHLQSDLNNTYTWVRNNNKKLNGTKFQHMHTGKSNKYPLYLTPENEHIQTFPHVKDIGTYFSSDFTFDLSLIHI